MPLEWGNACSVRPLAVNKGPEALRVVSGIWTNDVGDVIIVGFFAGCSALLLQALVFVEVFLLSTSPGMQIAALLSSGEPLD